MSERSVRAGKRISAGWFAALVGVGVAAVMTPAIVLASGSGIGGGFDAVVRGIEERYQVRATKIPFLGLMSGVARIASHGAVRGVHVAEFEHFDQHIDGQELDALVERRMGRGWTRMVRETSRNGADQNLVFVRTEGNALGMLVVDADGHEMNVVQVSLNPEQLAKFIDEPRKHRNFDGSDDEDGKRRHGKHKESDGDKDHEADESGD